MIMRAEFLVGENVLRDLEAHKWLERMSTIGSAKVVGSSSFELLRREICSMCTRSYLASHKI